MYTSNKSAVVVKWPIVILYIPTRVHHHSIYSTYTCNNTDYYSSIDTSNKYKHHLLSFTKASNITWCHELKSLLGRQKQHKKGKTQTGSVNQNKQEKIKYVNRPSSYNRSHCTGNSRGCKTAVQAMAVALGESNSGSRMSQQVWDQN